MDYEDLNDRRVSYYESRKGGWWARLVRRMTKWAWAPIVRGPINRAFERGMIDSRIYHEQHDYATRLIHNTPAPKDTHERPEALSALA